MKEKLKTKIQEILDYMSDEDQNFWENCQCSEEIQEKQDISLCTCEENKNHIWRTIQEVSKMIKDSDILEYPQILDKDTFKEYPYTSTDFFGGKSFKEDYDQALDFAKKNGGVLYTECNDEDEYTYLSKGNQYFDRLGYCVVNRIRRNLK